MSVEITPALLAGLKSKAENAKTISTNEPCGEVLMYSAKGS